MTTATHPLATRNGIDLLVRILEAEDMWRHTTKPQRRLITHLCQPVMAGLLALGVVSDEDLPHVEHFSIPLHMRKAMYRRGLLSERTGRLTARAVHSFLHSAYEPAEEATD